jgi:hypothetical protein
MPNQIRQQVQDLLLGYMVQLDWPGTGVIQRVQAGSRLFLYLAQEEADAEQIAACMSDLPKMSENLERVLKALGVAVGPLTLTADP